jgi:hypothetical protein
MECIEDRAVYMPEAPMPPEPAGPIGQAAAVFEAFGTLALNY